MSEPCVRCGALRVVEVHMPDRLEVVALVCLGCAAVQPGLVDHP
jgi:hypothetical protein